MSLNVLIIMPSVVKDRTELHTNVDEKLILPVIKRVQDIYVMPLLGSTLFNKIITNINANTLSGNYQTLVDNFLIDIVCNYVMAELPASLNAQFWNAGVSIKNTENGQTLQGNEIKKIQDNYRQYAGHYAQRAKRYLQQNANTLFPEYYQMVAGIDVVVPESNVFDCPIDIGTKEIFIKPQPSYNDPQQHNL